MKLLLAKFICSAIVATSTTGEAPLTDNSLAIACENAMTLVDASLEEGIDPFIMAGMVWVESRWQPTAVSSANACGLTQVLPRYAKETCEELKDPSTSLRVGAQKLRIWSKRGKGIEGGLACYNVGNRCANSSRGRRYSKRVRGLADSYREQAQGMLEEELQQCLPIRVVIAAVIDEGQNETYYTAGWLPPKFTPATVRIL